MILIAAPRDDMPVGLQAETMPPTSGDTHKTFVWCGNVALSLAIPSPRFDRSVGPEAEAVSKPAGHGDVSGVGFRNAALAISIVTPRYYRPIDALSLASRCCKQDQHNLQAV